MEGDLERAVVVPQHEWQVVGVQPEMTGCWRYECAGLDQREALFGPVGGVDSFFDVDMAVVPNQTAVDRAHGKGALERHLNYGQASGGWQRERHGL
jgi:hypothetical protein